MGQHLSYLQQSQWVTEGSSWRPSTRPPTPDVIVLRDEAGTPISSTTMTSMVLTLFDLMDPLLPIVEDVNQVDCKNTRGCTISSQGLFTIMLTPQDTVILEPTRAYEKRRALIQYTWSSGTKSDALEITFVVKNLHHRQEAAISVMRVIDAAQVALV